METALRLALKRITKVGFTVTIQLDTLGDEEADLLVAIGEKKYGNKLPATS